MNFRETKSCHLSVINFLFTKIHNIQQNQKRDESYEFFN